MAKADDGGPAYPVQEQKWMPGVERWSDPDHPGMSLRDYFAGQACVLMGADAGSSADQIAKAAYELADAMIAAREKETK
jgi:hypothetical protein